MSGGLIERGETKVKGSVENEGGGSSVRKMRRGGVKSRTIEVHISYVKYSASNFRETVWKGRGNR